MQRLRATYARGNEIRFITHLDLARLWERVLRRADLPLAFSEGYNPRPRISLAAPLALGVTSEHELMDVYLRRRVPLLGFTKAVLPQLGPGLELFKVEEVSLLEKSLQSQVRFAEYRVTVAAEGRTAIQVEASIREFLVATHLPWQHMRDTGLRHYDLRPMVEGLQIEQWMGDRCTLGMRLQHDERASARPEQVAAALGFNQYPNAIHRTRLILAQDLPRPLREDGGSHRSRSGPVATPPRAAGPQTARRVEKRA